MISNTSKCGLRPRSAVEMYVTMDRIGTPCLISGTAKVQRFIGKGILQVVDSPLCGPGSTVAPSSAIPRC